MKLLSLSGDYDGFHEVTFRDDMSVIVANRTEESTKQDSRNGLGKTTAIALIDFCLGGNSAEQVKAMSDRLWAFTLELGFDHGYRISVTRSPQDSSKVYIAGDWRALNLPAGEVAENQLELILGIGKWTEWLGQVCFETPGGTFPPPSFRSLIRHFIRYRKDAFGDPFKTFSGQPPAQVQAENAYLLHLDWSIAKEWADLKAREKRIDTLETPGDSLDDQIAALEPQLIRSLKVTQDLRNDLDQFKVLPEYREVEKKVTSRSNKMKDLTNENIFDRQQIQMYKAQVSDSDPVSTRDFQEFFDEVKISLGESVLRRINEAEEFFRQVEEHRTAYLAAEVSRIEQRIQVREGLQAQLSRENSEDLNLLRHGGALDDFIELQERFANAKANSLEVESKIFELNELSQTKTALKSERIALQSRTQSDLKERLTLRADIVGRFGEIMDRFLGSPADLQISVGKAGYQFKTTTPRSGSSGTHLMAIFAYDISITESLAQRGRGPGFLVHDSLIFADVDERQKAEALDIALRSSEEHGYQYVLTLNSDSIPWGEMENAERFKDAIVVELDDGSPEGSLLGIRLGD